MKIVYKCKESGSVLNQVDMSTFNGYIIQVEQLKQINFITEVQNNVILSKIKLRPTKTPLIYRVEYNGHVEYRYNNNNVMCVYYVHDDRRYGEFRKYDVNGELVDRIFYYNDHDITADVMKFIDYQDVNTFKEYKFKDDELFNLMFRYGTLFKFYGESKRESAEFDRIVQYCKL